MIATPRQPIRILRANENFRWPGSKRIAIVFNIAFEGWSDGEAPPIGPMGNVLKPGYFDANAGQAALEADFSFWTWGRFPMKDRALCFYYATRRDGSTLELGVEVLADGTVNQIDPPPLTSFKPSGWRVHRETRADPGFTPRQAAPMLDAPFYSRSQVTTRLFGEETTGVHEALDLDRFRSPWLKPMIAVRVPRPAGWKQAV